MKKEFLIALSVFIIVLSGCTSQTTEQSPQTSSANLDSFAQCLKEKGVKMYGSYICSACLATKKMFGSSFEYVEEIECHPKGPNPQTDLCLKRDIKKTPTWILEKEGTEINRLEGYQTFELLGEFSGCPFDGE
ncbi:hypothetical protein HYW20_02270 [Candidatus Woesearchaeota archaeon]|nr:hypothetical protein [Candidatus Woesearchaeota archaeon]